MEQDKHAPRLVDTEAYVSALRELVRAGHEAAVPIAGGSMLPFLAHGRDRIFFAAPDRPLRRGDMVFYQRPDGQYVMHRVARVRPEGLYLVGDAQTAVEGPLPPECVFARVTAAERKGKRITAGDFWWDFFAGPWLTIRPLRRLILKLYSMHHGSL